MCLLVTVTCRFKNVQAHLMSPHQTPTTTNWLFDSGASFHATNDLNNLFIHAPYNGTEELVIGYGLCLKISHIGLMIIHTPYTPLILTNVYMFLPYLTILFLSLVYVKIISF